MVSDIDLRISFQIPTTVRRTAFGYNFTHFSIACLFDFLCKEHSTGMFEPALFFDFVRYCPCVFSYASRISCSIQSSKVISFWGYHLTVESRSLSEHNFFIASLGGSGPYAETPPDVAADFWDCSNDENIRVAYIENPAPETSN